jgi:NADPH:quinone reductase-like Zn-dependent oxidoreductase
MQAVADGRFIGAAPDGEMSRRDNDETPRRAGGTSRREVAQPGPTSEERGRAGETVTMRAVVQAGYGTAPEEAFRLERIARPAIKPGEVLVRVRAASVDQGTLHLMTGIPYLIRLAGPRGPMNPVPGMAVAGTVEAVGRDVTGLEPGDEVFGTCNGSFAEYARARAGRLARKPANLTFEQAAAVPVSAVTALQAVRDKARVRPGQHVLITGASGGVGTFAVQIAKTLGAEVTGVCSTTKLDLVAAVGADHVIDYTREDFADGQRRYDAIIDIAGSRRVSHLRRALTPAGTLVITGGAGGPWLDGLDRNLRALLLSPFVRQKLTAFIARLRQSDLIALRDLSESGAITPAVDRTYPLSEAVAAVRHLADGRARGKVVISV